METSENSVYTDDYDDGFNAFFEEIKKNPQYDLERIKKAYDLARDAHKNQRRRSGEPYIMHPVAVAKILFKLGMDNECIIGALLHDVVEDTEYDLDYIRREFGDEVALLVDGVTKLTKIPLSTREDVQAENIRKMFIAMNEDVRVIIIKLCDRLHNMRTLQHMPPYKQREKSLEVLEIYAPIAHRLGIRPIKEELEDLAIYYLDPIAYKEIEKKIPKKKKITKEEEQIKVVDLSSTERPIAVMINNNKAVWGYQAGIQDAYITYEMIVEGGITRMMAVFKDKNTERIASVRSSRHYYLDYALENDAIYAHIGWSPRAESDIKTLNIPAVNANNSSAFTWDNSLRRISKEHRAYTSIAKIKGAAQKRGYRLTSNQKLLLTYQAKSLDLANYEGAVPASTVRIPYSTSHVTSYSYDSENKVYKRYQNGLEHKDYVTGAQYTAKNIITYKVHNYTLNDGYAGGRQDLNNIGTGDGYYISEGYAIPITWSKQSRSSKTVYKVKATGKELVVNDGNTFIQIEPANQTLTIE